MIRLLSLVPVVVCLLAACAATETPPSEVRQEEALPFELPPVSNKCVFMGRVRGFSVIDERHIVLEETAKRVFLVRLNNRCPGIRTATRIGVASRDGQLCGYRAETIVLPGAVPTRCGVLSLHEGRKGQFRVGPGPFPVESEEEVIQPPGSEPEPEGND